MTVFISHYHAKKKGKKGLSLKKLAMSDCNKPGNLYRAGKYNHRRQNKKIESDQERRRDRDGQRDRKRRGKERG
jgi:hypothetical protein